MLKNQIKYWENHSYCGTSQYYHVSINKMILGTDGLVAMANELQCYWFIDIISSYLPETTDTFMVARLHLKDNHAATFILDDGNGNVYHQQEIDFTDCTHNLQVFIAKEENTFIIYLPSEH